MDTVPHLDLISDPCEPHWYFLFGEYTYACSCGARTSIDKNKVDATGYVKDGINCGACKTMRFATLKGVPETGGNPRAPSSQETPDAF